MRAFFVFVVVVAIVMLVASLSMVGMSSGIVTSP